MLSINFSTKIVSVVPILFLYGLITGFRLVSIIRYYDINKLTMELIKIINKQTGAKYFIVKI